MKVYRLSSVGATFDLGAWTGQAGPRTSVSAVQGVMTSTLPGGPLY